VYENEVILVPSVALRTRITHAADLKLLSENVFEVKIYEIQAVAGKKINVPNPIDFFHVKNIYLSVCYGNLSFLNKYY
jgi:hypothetical protein